jgi:hypothetical protein
MRADLGTSICNVSNEKYFEPPDRKYGIQSENKSRVEYSIVAYFSVNPLIGDQLRH